MILVHSHLGLEWGATAAERFFPEFTGADKGGDESERPRNPLFNPKQANIIICDEDPTVSLVEEVSLSPEDIRGLGEDGLGEAILAGLVHPAGLLSHLRDHGVSADQLRDAAEGARKPERHRGQISSPEVGDGALAHAANSALRLVRISRVFDRLADELALDRRFGSSGQKQPNNGGVQPQRSQGHFA